jgi:capsular polysaccharide biosynthesis protein
VTKKYAIALAAAAALPGIAYLVFLGWIDRTTRNPKEIESRIGVRVVTTIGSLNADAA